MKKLLAIILTLVLLLTAVCACTDEKETTKKPNTNSSSVSSTEDTSSVESEISSEEATSSEATSSEEEVVDKPVVNTSSTPEEEEKEEKPENEDPKAEEEEELSEGMKIIKNLRGGINFSAMDHGAGIKNKNTYVYKREYYDLIAEAGFDHVRLPVGLGSIVISEGPEYLLDTEALRYLDMALEHALDAGLVIFLDNHHGSGYENKEKFVRIWEQIAERYRQYPDQLMFELVNEPNGMSDDHVNEVQMAAAEVIRKTNPTRILALAPNQWNGVGKVWDTQVPSTLDENGQIKYDPNVVMSVHMYAILEFTHQVLDGNPLCHWTDGIKDHVTAQLEVCADYEARTGRECWISEWGCYQGGHQGADSADGCMQKYYKHVTSEFARLDLAYAVWEFNQGFGVYNSNTNEFWDYLMDNMILTW